MLDRESEMYHSGLLDRGTDQEHLALVLTRDGVEVSAATKNLRFEYGSRWDSVRREWERAEQHLQARREAAAAAGRIAFEQRTPDYDPSEPLERN